MSDCISCMPKKNNFIFNEIPSGDLNCQNVTFSTSQPFEPSTLKIRLDGVTLDPNQYIIDASNQSFELIISSLDPKQLNTPPSNEEVLRVDYQTLSSNECITFL